MSADDVSMNGSALCRLGDRSRNACYDSHPTSSTHVERSPISVSLCLSNHLQQVSTNSFTSTRRRKMIPELSSSAQGSYEHRWAAPAWRRWTYWRVQLANLKNWRYGNAPPVAKFRTIRSDSVLAGSKLSFKQFLTLMYYLSSKSLSNVETRDCWIHRAGWEDNTSDLAHHDNTLVTMATLLLPRQHIGPRSPWQYFGYHGNITVTMTTPRTSLTMTILWLPWQHIGPRSPWQYFGYHGNTTVTKTTHRTSLTMTILWLPWQHYYYHDNTYDLALHANTSILSWHHCTVTMTTHRTSFTMTTQLLPWQYLGLRSPWQYFGYHDSASVCYHDNTSYFFHHDNILVTMTTLLLPWQHLGHRSMT